MPDLNGVLAALLFVVPGYLGLWAFDHIIYKDERRKREAQEILAWSYVISLVSFLITNGLADELGWHLVQAGPPSEFASQVVSLPFIGRVSLMCVGALVVSSVGGWAWWHWTKGVRRWAKRSQPSGYLRVWNKAFDVEVAPLVMVEMDDGTLFKGQKISASSNAPDRELLLTSVERFHRVATKEGAVTYVELPWKVQSVLLDTTKATSISFLHTKEPHS